MNKIYSSPMMTIECFKTEDIITISLHDTDQTINEAGNTNINPLPVIDADQELDS